MDLKKCTMDVRVKDKFKESIMNVVSSSNNSGTLSCIKFANFFLYLNSSKFDSVDVGSVGVIANH